MTVSFNHSLAPAIKFGVGLATRLAEELAPICTDRQVLIISDPGVKAAGLADAVMAALKRNGFATDLFNDLKGETSAASIDKAATMIRTGRPSAVVGLGGGSAMDAAKLAVAVSAAEHDAETYTLMRQPLPQRTAKLIMLPTTAGTGSEVTRTAVFTDSHNHKVWTWGDELAADLVILDPELTLRLPNTLTAATGLDAMVHAIEACTAKRSHPFAQAAGLQAIRLIFHNLAKAIDRPLDLNVRGNLLTAATLAGMALDGAGAGLAHSIGHALGTIAGIHHGRAVALALDVIFPKNATTAVDIHAQIAVILGVEPDTVEEMAKKGAGAFGYFMRRVGIDMSLKPAGLKQSDSDLLGDVILSEENTPMRENNCYSASESDISEFARQLLSR
ncbi:MAG: iron-containing alcohol dehydrogenase [Deltaproteobacteria bacterium]|nr:iron-containing alcohol dehydrogenase [Deltaproteobacteria bacterium]